VQFGKACVEACFCAENGFLRKSFSLSHAICYQLPMKAERSYCAQELVLKTALTSRRKFTPVRIALTIALLACSSASDLQSNDGVKQIRRGYEPARLAVRTERTRSISCLETSSLVKRTEQRRESFVDSHFVYGILSRSNVRFANAITDAHLIVQPDRLIELPGTPPPAGSC
jgi:hypothetical protein